METIKKIEAAGLTTEELIIAGFWLGIGFTIVQIIGFFIVFFLGNAIGWW
ncbi:MAG: hypothetical protein PHO02_01030 [Candidatus Nanoarchaeia archaeon]|nr:hypothetical protein [Candidatus Nanoarchaeia archaeon]